MKIFFLDIDGVLASHRAHFGHYQCGGKITHYDPSSLAMINTLGRATDAKCVIISSKRSEPQQLLIDLKRQGFKIPLHEDWCMPRHPKGDAYRADLIMDWCKKHHVKTDDILILDDDDCGYSKVKALAERFIRPHTHEGFGFTDCSKALDVLKLDLEQFKAAQKTLYVEYVKERSGRNL